MSGMVSKGKRPVTERCKPASLLSLEHSGSLPHDGKLIQQNSMEVCSVEG